MIFSPVGGFNQTEAVNFGGLAVEASLRQKLTVNRIDQTGNPAADSASIFCKGDILLAEHQLIESLLFSSVRDLIRHVGGGCFGFGIKFEAAQGIELCLFDKIH